jgi:hypothetical protein
MVDRASELELGPGPTPTQRIEKGGMKGKIVITID